MKKLCILFAAVCLMACFVFAAHAAVGDADGDSKITAYDARYVLRTAVKLEYPSDAVYARCDVDHNGAVTSADARTVLRVCVKLEAFTHPAPTGNEPTAGMKPATCTAPGVRYFYCACGEKMSEPIPARGHAPAPAKTENYKKATCAAAGGYDSVVYCAACGEELSRTHTVLEPLPHTPGDAVEENRTAATCTAVGGYDTVIYCTVCSGEVSRVHTVLEMLPHTPGEAVEENRVEPSCDVRGGYDTVIYCTVCGGELSREHTDLGFTRHVNADPVKENEVPPTCETAGSYDSVVYCRVCGQELSRTTETVPALGHPGMAAVAAPEAYIGAGPIYPGDTYYRCPVCGGYFADAAGKKPLGGMYDTLKNALADAKDGETVILLRSAVLAEDLAVPAGVTLLLPYGYGTNEIFVGGADARLAYANAAAVKGEDGADAYIVGVTPAGESVSVKLSLQGCTLTVPETARLVIGGMYSGGQPIGGGTCGSHAELDLDASSALNVSGTVSTYGYITGEGALSLVGGSLYEPMVITDYHGGTYSAVTYLNAVLHGRNATPFNSLACPNVQCPAAMDDASAVYGYCVLYASSAQNAATSVLISADKGLLQLGKGARLGFTYDAAVSVAGYEGLGRVYITANGDVTVQPMELKAAGMTLQTEPMYFSVPFHFAYVQQTGTLTLKQSLKLMPGAALTIGENAALDVQSALCVLDGFTPGLYSAYHYPAGDKLSAAGLSERAHLTVDGTMTVADGALFAGVVETTGTGTVTLSETALTAVDVSDGLLLNEVGLFYTAIATNRVELPLAACVVNAEGALVPMAAGKTYKALSGDETALTGYEYVKYSGDVNAFATETVSVAYTVPTSVCGVWAEE